MTGTVHKTYRAMELRVAATIRAFSLNGIVVGSAALWAFEYECISISNPYGNASPEFLGVSCSPNSCESLNERALSVVNMTKGSDVHFRLDNWFFTFLLRLQDRLCHASNHPFADLEDFVRYMCEGKNANQTVGALRIEVTL